MYYIFKDKDHFFYGYYDENGKFFEEVSENLHIIRDEMSKNIIREVPTKEKALDLVNTFNLFK